MFSTAYAHVNLLGAFSVSGAASSQSSSPASKAQSKQASQKPAKIVARIDKLLTVLAREFGSVGCIR
jgi:hypothetical protein